MDLDAQNALMDSISQLGIDSLIFYGVIILSALAVFFTFLAVMMIFKNRHGAEFFVVDSITPATSNPDWKSFSQAYDVSKDLERKVVAQPSGRTFNTTVIESLSDAQKTEGFNLGGNPFYSQPTIKQDPS